MSSSSTLAPLLPRGLLRSAGRGILAQKVLHLRGYVEVLPRSERDAGEAHRHATIPNPLLGASSRDDAQSLRADGDVADLRRISDSPIYQDPGPPVVLNSGSATWTIEPNSSQRSAVANRADCCSIRLPVVGLDRGSETVNDVGSISGNGAAKVVERSVAYRRGRRVKTKWYGHACSRIEGDGISIVIAPYIPEEAGPVPVEELSISALLRTTDPAN